MSNFVYAYQISHHKAYLRFHFGFRFSVLHAVVLLSFGLRALASAVFILSQVVRQILAETLVVELCSI